MRQEGGALVPARGVWDIEGDAPGRSAIERMKRRTLLLGGGAVLGGIAVPFSRLFNERSRASASASRRLVADPAGVLDLAPGFSYTVIERQLERMDDGYLVPRSPDGMVCLTSAQGAWVLLRNHELGVAEADADYLEGRPAPNAYDRSVFGGVTRVVVDPSTLARVRSNLVLTGTDRNCAGGSSPWGFLTCEESTAAEHGYVFVCSPAATQASPPQRITAYGRCRREAALVDPETNIAYQTEDEPDSCFYRFVPSVKERPFEGRLEALCVGGAPGFDTATKARQGVGLPVHWVALDEPEAVRRPLRVQALERGAALFRRGEGLWRDGRRVYICSTNGGEAEAGQIFVLELGERERLSLLTESPDREVLDMPDNITVGPGGVLYLAEDGFGEQYLRALMPDGTLFDVARNASSHGELAGCCFSPDGRVLFLNLYREGITVAITGPFPTPAD